MVHKIVKLGLFLTLAFTGISACASISSAPFGARNSKEQKQSITEKIVMWENPDPEGLGEIDWSSQYRFSDMKHSSSEVLFSFPEGDWKVIKEGTFYVNLRGSDWVQMRITNGWWSTTWTGADITTGDPRLILNDDGTYTLEINLNGDPLQDAIDEQHFLFTGQGYTPLSLYFMRESPEPGPYKVLWDSDHTFQDPSWGDDYRFGYVGGASPERCMALFSQDEWEIIKTRTFYMDFISPNNNPLIYVADGWWTAEWTGGNIEPGSRYLKRNLDGTWTLTIELAGSEAVGYIDERNLMFTGQHYTPIRIYYGAKPVSSKEVIWQNNDSTEVNWDGKYLFSNVENPNPGGQSPCYLFSMEIWERLKTEKFYLTLTNIATSFAIRVVDGYWNTIWTGGDIEPGNERLKNNGDGTWTLEVDFAGDPILTYLDDYGLTFSGGIYIPNELYFLNINPNHLINNDKRKSVSFRNKAYLSIDKDAALSGDTIAIEIVKEKDFDFTKDDLKVTYNDTETCELTQIGDYEFTFIMPDYDVNISAFFDTDYEVIFEMVDHGTKPEPITLHVGSKINAPDDPIQIGWTFCGWYKENTYTNLWNFDYDVVRKNTTLFARWEQDPLVSLEMKSNPTKVEYFIGEELDLRGAKVTATTTSGVVGDIDITPEMVSGYDKDKLGEQIITVTYEEFTTTFTVTVVPAPPVPVEEGMSVWTIVGISVGSALALLIAILLIMHFTKKKGVRKGAIDLTFSNIEIVKKQSYDNQLDEYVIKYDYKDRNIKYSMLRLKTLSTRKDEVMKQFNQLIKNGELKKYSNYYYNCMKRHHC